MVQEQEGSEPRVLAVGVGPVGRAELQGMRAAWSDYYGCWFDLSEDVRIVSDHPGRPDLVAVFWDPDHRRTRATAVQLLAAAAGKGVVALSVPLTRPGSEGRCARWGTLVPRFGPGSRPGDVARAALGFCAASTLDCLPDDVLRMYAQLGLGMIAVARGDLDVAPGLLRHLLKDHARAPFRLLYLAGGSEIRMGDIRRVVGVADQLAPNGYELLASVAEGLEAREVLVGIVIP